MSINKAIVVGNLGRDPEVRALPSGQNVANSQSQPRRDSRIGMASSRNVPNGIESLLSGSSRTTARPAFQGTPGLRRRTDYNPPVRSQGRKRQALPDRNRGAAPPSARQPNKWQR